MDQFPFDEGFENILLARFVRDRKFFFSYRGVVKESYFQSSINQKIFELVSKYYNTYTENMTIEVLKNEVTKYFEYSRRNETDEVYRQKYEFFLDTIDKLFTVDISSGEMYTGDAIVDFAKRKELERVILEAASRITKGENLDKISQEIIKVQAIGASVSLGYDYFKETARRITLMYEKPEHVVGTGYKRLDRYLGGGLAGGELGLVVGPPSRGKTSALVNLAVGAMINRRNAVYFVLEGPVEDVAVRFDMRLARKSKIVSKGESWKSESDAVYNFVTYFSRQFKAKLILQMFPTETASVKDLDDFLTHLELVDDFVPDVIFIDYLNLCKRPFSKEDIWTGRNYREGKALATRRAKPVWSAVQAKMGALVNDVISPKDIAEATGRIWADTDVILGLCQSAEEEKKKPMEMRWYLGKNRNRPAKRIVPMIFDSSIMLIEERSLKEKPTQEEAQSEN